MEESVSLVVFLMLAVVFIFSGWMWWRIFKKTGFSAALGLLMLVPVVNFVLLVVLAFKEWPVCSQAADQASGAAASRKGWGWPLITVIVLASAVPLMLMILGIALPNFVKARSKAHESMAQATVRNISTAIEVYAVSNNGNYPVNEKDLDYAVKSKTTYNGKTVGGYTYELNLRSDGYDVAAQPAQCGTTGNLVFSAQTGGKFSENKCR